MLIMTNWIVFKCTNIELLVANIQKKIVRIIY